MLLNSTQNFLKKLKFTKYNTSITGHTGYGGYTIFTLSLTTLIYSANKNKHLSLFFSLTVARTTEASCWYCIDAGKHFHVYLTTSSEMGYIWMNCNKTAPVSRLMSLKIKIFVKNTKQRQSDAWYASLFITSPLLIFANLGINTQISVHMNCTKAIGRLHFLT